MILLAKIVSCKAQTARLRLSEHFSILEPPSIRILNNLTFKLLNIFIYCELIVFYQFLQSEASRPVVF